MATSKPKLQGYVERSLFEQFEAERNSWQLTQSQALERVLSERYIKKLTLDKEESPLGIGHRLERLEETVHKLGDAFNELSPDLKLRLWLVEERLGLNSSLKITSDIQSEPEEITSDIQSSLPEITSDIQGEPEEITSDIQGNSPKITSDIQSSLLEITSDIQGEPKEITSDIQGSSPKITENPHPYFDRFLVCEVQRDGRVDYWGEDGGFTPDIRQAKLYEEKRYADAQAKKAQAGLTPTEADRIIISTARARLEIEIGIQKIPYSLSQIFDYWDKQEQRKELKRRRRRLKSDSVATA